MKLVSEIIEKSFAPDIQVRMVHQIACLGGWRTLEEPTLSNSLNCLVCGGSEHYTPFADPSKDDRRVWICSKGDCASNKSVRVGKTTPIQVEPKRAVVWPLFCEMNGIGDIHHGVTFECIEQTDAKIDYLSKFASKPKGIIFMQGDPGTGKTYASMAVCEFFTRTNPSCIFATQKQMFNHWLDTFKSEKVSNYIERLTNYNLLVIDDFGTGDISPGFMGFLMDIINSRMQWSDRGTIITTNLDTKKFNGFCGEALADRIMTGQHFVFKEKTRRKKTVL